jgi:hypothetical protein
MHPTRIKSLNVVLGKNVYLRKRAHVLVQSFEAMLYLERMRI